MSQPPPQHTVEELQRAHGMASSLDVPSAASEATRTQLEQIVLVFEGTTRTAGVYTLLDLIVAWTRSHDEMRAFLFHDRVRSYLSYEERRQSASHIRHADAIAHAAPPSVAPHPASSESSEHPTGHNAMDWGSADVLEALVSNSSHLFSPLRLRSWFEFLLQNATRVELPPTSSHEHQLLTLGGSEFAHGTRRLTTISLGQPPWLPIEGTEAGAAAAAAAAAQQHGATDVPQWLRYLPSGRVVMGVYADYVHPPTWFEPARMRHRLVLFGCHTTLRLDADARHVIATPRRAGVSPTDATTSPPPREDVHFLFSPGLGAGWARLMPAFELPTPTTVEQPESTANRARNPQVCGGGVHGAHGGGDRDGRHHHAGDHEDHHGHGHHHGHSHHGHHPYHHVHHTATMRRHLPDVGAVVPEQPHPRAWYAHPLWSCPPTDASRPPLSTVRYHGHHDRHHGARDDDGEGGGADDEYDVASLPLDAAPSLACVLVCSGDAPRACGCFGPAEDVQTRARATAAGGERSDEPRLVGMGRM